ncbi:MAG: hypothetical protein ACXACA_05460 [Candidatus Ranarchaeia archaeon]|jgi:hypothetical protein
MKTKTQPVYMSNWFKLQQRNLNQSSRNTLSSDKSKDQIQSNVNKQLVLVKARLHA